MDFLLHLLMVELLGLCVSHNASWLLPCFLARKLEKVCGGGLPGVASGCCMVTVAAEQLQETEHVMCGLRAVAHPGVGLQLHGQSKQKGGIATHRSRRAVTHCP